MYVYVFTNSSLVFNMSIELTDQFYIEKANAQKKKKKSNWEKLSPFSHSAILENLSRGEEKILNFSRYITEHQENDEFHLLN